MLRYVVLIVFVLCLAVVGALLYQWAEMLREREAQELARRKAAEGEPARLLFSPKEKSDGGGSLHPGKAKSPVPPAAMPEQPAAGQPQKGRVTQGDFLLAVLDSAAQALADDSEELALREVEGPSFYRFLNDGQWHLLPGSARKAVLAVEGLAILDCDVVGLIGERYWTKASDFYKAVLLTGLRQPWVVDTSGALRKFLLDVAFSDREDGHVRSLALDVLAAKDTARYCTAELSFFFSLLPLDNPLWPGVADLLARKCGDEGRSVLMRMLESAEREGNEKLENDLTAFLSWAEGVDKEIVIRDILEILLRRYRANRDRRLIGHTFRLLDPVFARVGGRGLPGIAEKLIGAFELAQESDDRLKLVEFLDRCESSVTGLDFLLSVLERDHPPGIRRKTAALLQSEYASTLAQANGGMARLLQIYEREASPEIRGALAALLAGSQGVGSMPQMQTLYEKEPEPSVRRQIAAAIGQWCKPEAFAQLQGMLEREPDSEVRGELIRAMAASDFGRGLAYMEMVASKEGDKNLREIVQELRQRVR